MFQGFVRASAALVGIGCAAAGCSSSGNGSTAGAAGNAAGAAVVAGASGSPAAQGGLGGVGGNLSMAGSAGTQADVGGGGAGAGSGGAAVDSCAGPEPTTYPQAPFTPDADTVAWYKLDDVTDSGPLKLDLTNSGAVDFKNTGLDWPDGAKNGVAHFKGTAQSLSRTGLTVGNDFTLDAHVFWRGFRHRTCGAVAQLLALTSGKSGVVLGQACGVAAGPRVRVNDTTDMVPSSAFEDIADDTWHWVRFAIAGGKLSFSVDGAALGTPVAVDGLGTATWTLALGGGFSGDIDEARLSKKALAATTPAPRVTARPAYRELELGKGQAQLTATVDKPGAQVLWTKLRGPGRVVFGNPTALTTQANFCMPGKYVLQAVASDGAGSGSDELVVNVWPEGGRKQPYKVLFLGNSFSFYNGTVGYRFWEFSKAAGEAVGDSYAASPFVKHITSPGQPFQFHWYETNANSECTNCPDHVLPAPPTVNLTDFVGQSAQDVIADGGWDVVVMQSYSTAASRDPINFARYGKKLDRLVKRSGARTVLYQTWSYPGVDNTTAEEATLLANYEKLADETGAAISKVGHAFKDARSSANGNAGFPDGILFTDDKHPNSFGTYLAAAVHFGVIYGKSPANLALYPATGDISTPTMDSNKSRADMMRAIAATYAAASPLQGGP